jgi:FkbM family methyltransferase
MNEPLNIDFYKDFIIKENNGIQLLLNPLDQYITRDWFITGEWEPHNNKIFNILVKKGDIVLDCGANIGIHTITLSKLVGDTGKVLCFEPCRTIFNQLVFNTIINKCSNVAIYPVGVGRSSSIGYISKEWDKRSAELKNWGTPGIDFEKDEGKYPVQIVSIDDLDISPSFIKIDIERMEEEAIMGMTKTMEKCKPLILVEIHKEEFPKMAHIFDSLNYGLISNGSGDYLACPKEREASILEKLRNS